MKLTQYMKEQLKKKVIAEKITPRLKVLEEKELVLVMSIYEETLTKVPNLNLLTIDDLPKNWFVQTKHLSVYFNGFHKHMTLDDYRPLPYHAYNEGLRLTYEDTVGKMFCDRFTQLTHEDSVIQLDKKELLSELDRVLRPINTYKKLIEAWPEASDYLAPPVPPSLPMVVNVDKLRSLLG